MKSKEYNRLRGIWRSMKHRCYHPNTESYKDYGARGIRICDEWLNSFDNFLNWSMANGYTNSLTIDRIDNDSDYSPRNCRWVDMKTQSANRRNNHLVVIDGEKKILSEWLQIYNISKTLFWQRVNKGMTECDAIKTPIRKVENIIGKQIGLWTVVRKADTHSIGKGFDYICRCRCGNIAVVKGYSLSSGATQSCGCVKKRRVLDVVNNRIYPSINECSRLTGINCNTLYSRLNRNTEKQFRYL